MRMCFHLPKFGLIISILTIKMDLISVGTDFSRVNRFMAPMMTLSATGLRGELPEKMPDMQNGQ